MEKRRLVPGTLSDSDKPDYLKEVRGKPMITEEMPGTRYLGRVIVELYEIHGEPDDRNIAYSIDTAHGANIEAKTLVKRIAAALYNRVAKDSQ